MILPPPPAHARLLVADIGGTHARLGWSDAAGQLALQSVTPVNAHASMDALLAHCVAGIEQAEAMVLAVAGQVSADGDAHCANVPWGVSASALQQRWQRPVQVLNDFHALALACARLPGDAGQPVCGPQPPDGNGPVLVIGPGTGLGAALLLADGSVLPGEAGHMALAAGSARQDAVLAGLRAQRGGGHVPVEAAVSGPGLLALYRVLCALDQVPAVLDTPAAVSQAAMAGSATQAMEALWLFCHWLGSFCGDLALATGARRIWLAGGILPHIHSALPGSGLATALTAKGVLAPVLAQVGVRWIEHGALGLRGAALAWRPA